MIAIVDYGMGNLGSISNMLRRIGAESIVTSDLGTLRGAHKLILPGVGAFDNAINRINETGMREVLDQKALREYVPILGICLGMQLLTRGSEEGCLPGFGWIQADTRRFSGDSALNVPHMGWNSVWRSTESQLTENFEDELRMYFVHSYYVTVDETRDSILKTKYGIEFDSAIQRKNIYGAQFHPEKSHRFGMKLFKNFAAI